METIDENTANSAKMTEPVRVRDKITVLDLFRPMQIGVRTLNMCFQWFSVTMCYYGLAFASTSLSGDPYSNFFLRLIIIYYSQCREREDQGYYYRQCSGRDPRISVLYLCDGLLGTETHPVILSGYITLEMVKTSTIIATVSRPCPAWLASSAASCRELPTRASRDSR